MPRIFSEGDREAIRQTLIDAGKAHFLRYGLRKTNVDELARAAGIGKGTFYRFFESKEELCLAIYDEEQEAMRRKTGSIFAAHADPAGTLKALLDFALEFVGRDSLLMRLRETGEYSLLARGVGKERLARHLDNDLSFAAEVVDDLKGKGARCEIESDVMAGVLRAFVMLAFHENEIGADVFPAVMELIGKWLAAGMAAEGEGSGKSGNRR